MKKIEPVGSIFLLIQILTDCQILPRLTDSQEPEFTNQPESTLDFDKGEPQDFPVYPGNAQSKPLVVVLF